MEVEYSLTFQDMEALARYQHRRLKTQHVLPTAKRALWIPVFALLLTALTNVLVFFGPKLPPIDTQWWDAFWYGLFAGLLLGCLPLLVVRASRWKAAVRYAVRRAYNNEESRWMFAPQRMQIDVGGFSIFSENHQLSYSWAVVCEIGVTPGHAFFYTAPIHAHVLPRRAFRDQQHFQEFIDLAQQYQQGAARRAPKETGIIAGLPPQSSSFTRPNVP